jgi:hypothetical protein
MKRSGSLTVIAVAFALLVTACGSGTTDSTTPTNAKPATTTTVPSTDDLVDQLASVGIGVYDTFDATAPVAPVDGAASPLKLQRDQLEGLTAELESGGGVTGSELDQLVAMPDGAPPFSYLVAGWVTGYDSPEAAQALTLLGGSDAHDWTHTAAIMFPNLVVVLFVSNLARESAAEAATASINGMLASNPIGAGTVCSGLSGWINGVLDSIFNSLKIDDDSWVPSIITDIWNLAVDLVQTVVEGLVDALGATVLAAIKIGLAIAGTLSLMASYMKPWVVTLTSDPASDHLTHEGEATHTGIITATVTTGGSDSWAAEIVDCANLAGIELPSPGTEDKPITWKTKTLAPVPLAVAASKDSVVSTQGTAQLHYETLPEPPEDTDGDLYEGQWQVTVTVDRLSEEEITELLDSIVFDGIAGDILEAVLGPLLSGVKSKLAALMEVNGSMIMPIGYHLKDEPEDIEAQSCFTGLWMSTGFSLPVLETEGGAGVMMTISSNGNGLMDFSTSLPFYYYLEPDDPAPGVRLDQTGSIQFSVDENDHIATITKAYAIGYSLTPYAWMDEWVAGNGVQDLNGSGSGPGATLTCVDDSLTFVGPQDSMTYYFTRISDTAKEQPPPPDNGEEVTETTSGGGGVSAFDPCGLLTLAEVQKVFPDATEPDGEDDLPTTALRQCTYGSAFSIQVAAPASADTYVSQADMFNMSASEIGGIGEWTVEAIAPANDELNLPESVGYVAAGSPSITILITPWMSVPPGSEQEKGLLDLLKTALSRAGG